MRTMETEIRNCPDCGITEFEMLGMIPINVAKEVDSRDKWIKAALCTDCGSVEKMEVTEEELEDAAGKIVEAMYDHEIISDPEYEELQ